MSRTIRNRHNKYGCHIKLCGNSDKQDKILANKKFRRKNRIDAKLSVQMLEDMFRYNHIRNVSDIWNFNSDGFMGYIDFRNKKYNNEEYSQVEQNKYKSK